MNIKAFKMDGLGNNFVIIDRRKSEINLTKEQIIPIVVDFPAPFGPSNAKKSPFFTLRLILSRALKESS